MNRMSIRIAIVIGLMASALQAQSTDLHITLRGSEPISRKIAHFACDSNAVNLGLPAGVFEVEYINGDGNSLAVLPIGGKSLIFTNVVSGSGARYAAGRYIWSDGGIRGAFLSSDSLAGQAQTLCHQIYSGSGKQ